MKSYCMNCRKEIDNGIQRCKCGGKFFVYGEKFHFGENGIVCDCGSDKFSRNMHMDFTHKAVTNYNCMKCSNAIGTESYRDKSDMMYWEDDFDYEDENSKYEKRVRNRQKLFNKRKSLGRRL